MLTSTMYRLFVVVALCGTCLLRGNVIAFSKVIIIIMIIIVISGDVFESRYLFWRYNI